MGGASPLTQQSHHTSRHCLRVCWDCTIYLLCGWENKPISPFVIFFNFIRITQSPFTSWLLHSFHILHVSQNLSSTDMCPMWTFEKFSIYNFVISEMYSWYSSFGNQPVVTIAKVGFILYVHNSWWNISFLNAVISTNVYLNNNQQKELVIEYTLVPNLDYCLSIYLLNQVTLARSSYLYKVTWLRNMDSEPRYTWWGHDIEMLATLMPVVIITKGKEGWTYIFFFSFSVSINWTLSYL